MVAIGRYLLLIISLAGMTLSVDRFSQEDIDRFLDYIFRLHNLVRFKHHVVPLKRTKKMDSNASNKMVELVNETIPYNGRWGTNHNSINYNENTNLDHTEAIKVFSLWYEQGNFYDYENETDSEHAVIIGGFTQIVWARTTSIGLTFWYDENQYKVLAFYHPFGNTPNRFIMNVIQPNSRQPVQDPAIPELIYQTETEKFLDYVLEVLNEYRLQHGVPQLQRDNKLDLAANLMIQRGDYTLAEGHNMSRFQCSYDEDTILDAEKAREMLSVSYNGMQFYDHQKPRLPYSNYTDEFTQIVWKSTCRIGMGIQRRSDSLVIVALFYPGGNISEQFESNVFRPRRMDQGESSGNY